MIKVAAISLIAIMLVGCFLGDTWPGTYYVQAVSGYGYSGFGDTWIALDYEDGADPDIFLR